VRGRESGGALHASALIATFHCAAPVRCGAFADARRVVAGEGR